VAENQCSFPPLAIGRFFVRGSHVTLPSPPGSWPIRLDAGIAFGSGEHATTRGCLLAIAAAAKRRVPRRALDLGCGSAILAIALARAGTPHVWPRTSIAIRCASPPRICGSTALAARFVFVWLMVLPGCRNAAVSISPWQISWHGP